MSTLPQFLRPLLYHIHGSRDGAARPHTASAKRDLRWAVWDARDGFRRFGDDRNTIGNNAGFQAYRRFAPLYQSETVIWWITAENNRLAMKAEDNLNEKYLFKRIKLEPGNYRLTVVHRAHGGGLVGSDTVEFVAK